MRERAVSIQRHAPFHSRAGQSGRLRLVEIPVNHRPRRFGQSKYGLGNRALRATIDMFGVRWLLSRRLNYKIRE